jgi:hypothetical protein
MKDKIKFYPVGNGDQSLITLKDGTTILVDCNIRQASVDSTDPLVFDVKKDLLKSISKRDNNPFVDVFVLTHGDCDHCRGYETNFYPGDPKKYAAKNREANEIIVDEMWFSPMIAEENTNEDEDVHQTEAERRLNLHRTNHADKNLPGNRIKIIGYDGNKEYSDLEHLRAVPGKVIDTINNKTQNTFSVFIHAPFKEHLKSAEKDKNSTSIVFQARFKDTATDEKFSGLAIFGGDSDHYSWDVIHKKTIDHGNDKKQALNWDLFLAPHHCSWSFFNDRPQDENPDPTETSLKILDYKRTGGRIIASSKKIVDDADNPPHYEAKQQYLKKLTSASDFLNTVLEPKEAKPEPIIFEITSTGVNRVPYSETSDDEKLKAAVKVASASVIKQPWCK